MTPPVLGGAALFAVQRQQCFKILCPKDPEFHTPLELNCTKGSTSQHWCMQIGLPFMGGKITGMNDLAFFLDSHKDQGGRKI